MALAISIVGGDRTVPASPAVIQLRSTITDGTAGQQYRWQVRSGTSGSWRRVDHGPRARNASHSFAPGTWQIRARVRARAGDSWTSAIATITSAATTVTVDAGSDVTVTRGENIRLEGTATVTNGSGETAWQWEVLTGSTWGPWRDTQVGESVTTDRWPVGSSVQFRVSATNNGVTSDWDTVTVTIREPTTVVVDAGGDRTVQVGTTVTLTATATVTHGVGETTWEWQFFGSLGGGRWTTVRRTREYSFPVSGTGSARWRVRATNNGVTSAWDEITLTAVSGPINTIVRVDAGPDVTLELGQTHQIQASATVIHPVGETAYLWSRVSRDITGDAGVAGSTSLQPTFSDASIGEQFQATGRTTDARFNYSLRVTNNNVSASDQVTITVRPPRTIVTALAGPDREMTAGASITLTAGARVTRPSGETTYAWQLVSGDGDIEVAGADVTFTADDFSGTVSRSAVLRLTASNNGVTDTDDVTITIQPITAARAPLQVRLALRVHPVGERRGFAFWAGARATTIEGVEFAPGEVSGLGSWQIDFGDARRAVTVLLDGEDPVLRAWLLQGPGARTCELLLLGREAADTWAVMSRFVGTAGAVTRVEGGGFTLDIDPEVLAPAPRVRLTWSDETQRDLHPGDRGLENLKRLAEGVTVIWPA